MGFFQNTCKPKGLGGRFMLSCMNKGHGPLADWGLSHMSLRGDETVLDLGCGGGANVQKLLSLCPQGSVTGADYSPLSVSKAAKVNEAAIGEGKCRILEADAQKLPFEDGSFGIVTAFETVYFWPNLLDCFRQVHRVLQEGGTFLICNEADGKVNKAEYWTQRIQGMMVYSGLQLEAVLRMAGFSQVRHQENGKGWLCVLARK